MVSPGARRLRLSVSRALWNQQELADAAGGEHGRVGARPLSLVGPGRHSELSRGSEAGRGDGRPHPQDGVQRAWRAAALSMEDVGTE